MSVFVKKEEGKIVAVIAMHVDDQVLMSKDKEEIARMKKATDAKFGIPDLGPVKHFLGMDIVRDRSARTLTIGQGKYLRDVLKRFKMEASTPVSTPVDGGKERLSKLQCPRTEGEKKAMSAYPYRTLVGSLMYLAVVSRPDISYIVSVLSQFLENPGRAH
eukprot:TRINITY_DN846_c0_g1_i4.p1 TRINITY_DN846_c0_g1~~TRINITY_DN846_c0_g1_i4.p1  ORF type:complete len:160 (-),score=16.61 TRINITY_DN846_c0_g1_i4:369-848(-)